MRSQTKKKLLVIGSFLLGFGFMGATDGIVFHQLLQWHSVVMETSRSDQIMSDGIFHFAVTIALVAGGFILWLAGNPSDQNRGVKQVIGWFFIGSGLFKPINEGHDHLYMNGDKKNRIYGQYYDLGTLEPVVYKVKVTINTNNHKVLMINGKEIAYHYKL